MNGLYSGVWIDTFDGSYNQVAAALSLCADEIPCAIVSPELHGRSHLDLWSDIKHNSISSHRSFQICTDFPEEAFHFFNQ